MRIVTGLLLVVCLTGCGQRDRSPEPPPVPPPTRPSAPRPAPPPLPPTDAPRAQSQPPSTPATDENLTPNEIMRQYLAHWNDTEERARLIDVVAIRALETGNQTEAVRLFTEMLKVETAPELKMTLLDELGSSELPAALPAILSRISPAEPEEVRESAMAAAEMLLSMLGLEKKPDAFEPVVGLLDPKYPAALRELAITTLEDLEDKRAIPHLQRLLTDPDENVRAAAQAAIEWLQQE